MFKWLKDRWNYLCGEDVKKQGEQFSPTDNYLYTFSVSPATTTDGKEHSDAGSPSNNAIPIADLSDDEFLKSLGMEIGVKSKEKPKKKKSKKSNKKGKKK